MQINSLCPYHTAFCHFANSALVCVLCSLVACRFSMRRASAECSVIRIYEPTSGSSASSPHACNTFNRNSIPHYHINWIRLNRFGLCVAIVNCRHLVLTDWLRFYRLPTTHTTFEHHQHRASIWLPTFEFRTHTHTHTDAQWEIESQKKQSFHSQWEGINRRWHGTCRQ